MGVCLMEIASGEDLFEHLGLDEEGLRRWYCDGEEKEIEERMESIIHNSSRGEELRHLRSLMRKFLSLNPSKRISSNDCEASFLHWGNGTTTSTNDQHLKEIHEKMDEILEGCG